ncbi:MAG: hypothetical protein HPY50_03090 [Firmicutes bacterium]|nr:hypothetical protein [Bacillota bacterium]
MRETELKIPFPTEKLDALRFFMAKKDLNIEQELKETLEKTYEKIVPAHVREYVESRLEQGPAQEQIPEPEAHEHQLEEDHEPEASERQPERTHESEASEQQPEQQRDRQPRQSRRRQREQAAAEAAPVSDSQREDTTPAEEESQGLSMSM